MTIGEVARRLRVSVPTLRRWDRAGTLRPQRDPLSGYRVYARREVEAMARAKPVAAPLPPPPKEDRAFVGRSEDRALALEILARGEGLLFVVGPPGIGKTTFAAKVAREAAKVLSSRVAWIDLSGARDEGDLDVSVAEALGVEAVSDDAEVRRAHLHRALLRFGRGVLVLDEADRVIDVVACAVRAWKDGAPRLRVVVASRARPRADVETIALDALATHDAVALLVARAGSALSAEESKDAHAVLARITHKLQGIPLALELAAARLATLSPRELLHRLDASLDALGRRSTAHRHTTLRAAIESSWETLDDAERTTLAQLSVFRGACTLASAEAVVRGADVGETIPALVARSMVRASRSVDDPSARRFELLAPIRELAEEKLRGARDEVSARHATHYAELARQALDADAPALARLRLERDDVLRAHATALSLDASRALLLALALEHALPSRVFLHEILSRLEASLAAAASSPSIDPTLVARALALRAKLDFEAGPLDRAHDDLRRARTLVQGRGAPAIEEYVVSMLGVVQVQLGRYDEAMRTLADAERLADATADSPTRRFTWSHRGSVHHEANLLPEAERSFSRAMGVAEAAGDVAFAARMLARLGRVWSDMGDGERAIEALRRAHEVLAPMDDRFLPWCDAHRATVCRRLGAFDEARALYAPAVERLSKRGALSFAALHRALLAATEADLGREVDAVRSLETARAEGGALRDATIDAGLELAACHIELCVARRRGAGSHEAHERARRSVERLRPLAARDKDVRLAVELLQRALSEDDRLPRTAALVVAADASWLTPPRGARRNLPEASPLRGVLRALIEAHDDGARPLDVDALLRAGWPGERVVPNAAAQRVHSAIARLRAEGLRAHLQTIEGGWSLDASLSVRIEPTVFV